MARHYAIIKQQDKWSRHGGRITEITMVGLDDRLPYTTWIDPTNMNNKHWTHITSRPEHGFIVTGLKKKRVKDRDDVINADGRPVIAWEHTSQDDLLDTVMSHWQQQDAKNKPPSFGDFFAGDHE